MRKTGWTAAAFLGLMVLGLGVVSGSVEGEEIGHYDTEGDAQGVAVSGDYAYVADGSNGLVIVDITNKAELQEMGNIDTADYAYDVAVADDYTYIADGDNGLVIVNITNKAEPQDIGNIDTAGYARGVAVADDYAYVADGDNGLVIVDITNKINPKKVGHLDTSGFARGVVVAGDYAYIADYYNGLVIVDITNKTEPQETGRLDLDGARGVVVVGDYVYIAEYYNGLVIVDITDKTEPQETGHLDSGFARGVAVADDYAYVADDNNGLVIVDITNKANPQEMGNVDTLCYVRSVEVAGDYTYIADSSNGLVIVNLKDYDGDSVENDDDAFPTDPAASLDTDSDGYPDEWNMGKSQTDSTRGLRLDAFPTDPAASLDTDSDGYPDKWNLGKSQTDSTRGLRLDAFPTDPAASLDSDNDGYPDEWNIGKSQSDSTTGLRLDAFPTDPAASLDSDNDGYPDEWNIGKSQSDSTTGLRLDAFPTDLAASLDSDNDGYPDEWNIGKSQSDSTTRLRLDAFPTDLAASLDSDNDGYPDEWNSGKSQSDSATKLELDEFPDDPNEWQDSDGDGYGNNGDDYPNTSFLHTHWQLVGIVLFVVCVVSGIGGLLATRWMKLTTQELISETKKKVHSGDGWVSTQLFRAETDLIWGWGPLHYLAARSLVVNAHSLVDKENELRKELKKLAFLISRNEPAAELVKAKEFHGRAREEMGRGNFQKVGDLINQGKLAAKPSTDHLLTEARKLDIAAEEDYEKKDYDSAAREWKEAKAVYTRAMARELMKAREDVKLLEKVREKMREISENIEQTEKNKAAEDMRGLASEYEGKVAEANRLLGEERFNEAQNSYEQAGEKLEAACQLAREYNHPNLEGLSEERMKLKKKVEDTRLGLGEKMLGDARSLLEKDPTVAEKKFCEVEEYLKKLEIGNAEGLQRLLYRTRTKIAEARIIPKKKVVEEAQELYEKKEFVRAKNCFTELEIDFKSIRDYAMKHDLKEVKAQVDEHIKTCRTNIDLAAEAPFHRGKGIKHPLVNIREGTDFSGWKKNVNVPPQERGPQVSGKDIGIGSFYDYEQGKEVGEGSFARVFQAVNKKTGAVVAIKQQKFSQEVLDETQTLDTTDFKDFLQEASLWYKLTKRNIKGVVKVFGYGVKPKPWIAMEFMPQGSLKEKVGTLDVNEASQVTIQLLESMNRVADMGVVHRDIKPANILFTKDGVPTFADWGLGRQLLEATQSLGYRGTPYYSAPEQFDDNAFGEISRKTDLYQIGAVYYELLTGRKPFSFKNPDKLMYHILNETPDPPSTLNPNVPKALDEIVLKALSKKQKDRYDFLDMVREIRKVMG